MSAPKNPPLFEAEVQWHDSVGNPVERGVVQAATEITLRDLFAAAALINVAVMAGNGAATPESVQDNARWAYELADAMLRERAK